MPARAFCIALLPVAGWIAWLAFCNAEAAAQDKPMADDPAWPKISDNTIASLKFTFPGGTMAAG